jgi:hypothetical protein
VGAGASDEVRLAEFASLRQEIGQRSTAQQALLALNVTIAGTVAGFALSGSGREELFVIVAFASSTFGLIWLDHHASIHQLAAYISDELWVWEPSWESYNRRDGKPQWWQVIYVASLALVFEGIAIAAVVISGAAVHGLLRIIWWIAIGLTGVACCSFAAHLVRGDGRAK